MVAYRRSPGPPLGRLAPVDAGSPFPRVGPLCERTSVPGTGSPADAASRGDPGDLGYPANLYVIEFVLTSTYRNISQLPLLIRTMTKASSVRPA